MTVGSIARRKPRLCFRFPTGPTDDLSRTFRRTLRIPVGAFLVIVCVIPVCYPFPNVALKVLYSFLAGALGMAPDRLQASAVPPLVEIVRQRSSGLGIAPREAAPSRAARATFPFCLGRHDWA